MSRRRRFLGQLLAGGTGALLGGRLGPFAQDRPDQQIVTLEEGGLAPRPARWWKPLPEEAIECGLCPHQCQVGEGERGTCGVRENRRGKYYTLVHSRPCSVAIDPVEKKPFYHFLPGTAALSLATPGCNFSCKCCQNWEIAQARPEQVHTATLTPTDLTRLARDRKIPIIACTYTEPVVWSEYVLDIAAAGRTAGIRTVVISNGFIQELPLLELGKVLAGFKVDLKGFRDAFYKEHCAGRLQPVLDTLKRLKQLRVWTEIVVLVIPTQNDSPEEIRDLARWVAAELGPDVPVHFTRFHPAYRMTNLPSTPVPTLERARDLALAEGLRFVYVGNVPGHPGNHTYCPSCRTVVIRRMGMAVVENRLQAGKCPKCQQTIPGVWS